MLVTVGNQDKWILARMIRDRVFKTLRDADVLDEPGVLVVAVSGGADSVALLHLLLGMRAETGLNLRVASLDHGMRGEAGGADLRFVLDLAEKWGLPCSSGTTDVKALSRDWGMGAEEAARRARYDFLAAVARGAGARYVAAGHHADDQAETILMRIVRGSGTRGLRGMDLVSPLPGHPDLRLIRPLLGVTRAEIEAYCAEKNLPFRHDRSNDDTAISRNFLRHEALVRLRTLNPQLHLALARLAETARVDDDFIASQLEAKVFAKTAREGDHWRIARSDFAALHPALRRRFLRGAVEALAGGYSLDYASTLAAVEWAQRAAAGARRHLGAGLELRMGYGDLAVAGMDAEIVPAGWRLLPAGVRIALDLSDGYEGFGFRIRRVTDDETSPNRIELPHEARLWLRGRRAGDRFQPKGMGGRSRKLKDWMIDLKIPRELRDRIPLLVADGLIVAICLESRWHLAYVEPGGGESARQTLRLS